MNRLAALQTGFQAFLLGGEGRSFRAAIVDDPRLGAERRLGIYRHAYRLRLVEALAEAYPKLVGLLGDDLFERLAGGYVDAHPSSQRNLRWYGERMADHLAGALGTHPIAAELAALEWVLGLSFDARDAEPLGMDALAALPAEDWGDLCLRFHPSVRLLDLKLNTVAVWQALDEGRAPPAAVPAPRAWLIWRRGLDPHYRSLAETESRVLALALRGTCFAGLCDALAETEGDEGAAARAAEYLVAWLGDGLVVKSP